MKKQEAIAFFGGAKKLAIALGVSPASVSQWGIDIPELRAYQIEKLTRGKLKVNSAQIEYKKAS